MCVQFCNVVGASQALRRYVVSFRVEREIDFFRDGSRRRLHVERIIGPRSEVARELAVHEHHGARGLRIEPHVAAQRHRVRVRPVREVGRVAEQQAVPHEREVCCRAAVRVEARLASARSTQSADHCPPAGPTSTLCTRFCGTASSSGAPADRCCDSCACSAICRPISSTARLKSAATRSLSPTALLAARNPHGRPTAVG